MSYSAKGDGKFIIKKENIQAALEAAGCSFDEGMGHDEISEMLENETGFSVYFDSDGNICKTIFAYNYFDSDEVREFLESIAPYVESGSCISFEGEDGDCWDYDFDGDSVSGGPHDDW